MAAITPDSEVAGGPQSIPYQRLKHEVYEFLSQAVADGDTWDLNGMDDGKVVYHAFEAANSGSRVATSIVAGSGIAFTSDAGTNTGKLHIWRTT